MSSDDKSTLVPRDERTADNPRGYVREPDYHPRLDATPQGQLGILGRLRQAIPLLSVGASKRIDQPIAPETPLFGFRHSSPEPRVLRVAYPGITAAERVVGTGIQVSIVITEGVDTGGMTRTIRVPLCGVAISIPAGEVTAEVRAYQGVAIAADNTVNATLSAGKISHRWIPDPDNPFLALPVFPVALPVVAPTYATRIRATCLSGSVVGPTGAVLGGPGFQLTVAAATAGNAVAQLSGGVPGTTVLVDWEITE